MQKPYSLSRLRADLFRIVDRVLATRTPVEVERNGQRVRLVPVEEGRRLDSLKPHPGFLRDDPDAYVHLDWSEYWRP